MFSIDTESGFRKTVIINAAWGLGELVVQGAITPDEYVVFKPLINQLHLAPIIGKSLGEKARKMVYAKDGTAATKTVETSKKERGSWVLSHSETLQLARWACAIENHYQMPMDMEWAKDGLTGELFILQARPETVQSQREDTSLKSYRLTETPEEGDRVLAVLAEQGLARGEHGLQVYVMAEIPSNIILAGAFAERFDGFSVGSNDLTQLILGVDRDSEELAELFDERHEAVTSMIRALIRSAHQADRKVGICGQAPSDHPEFAAFLVSADIDSISVNPDSFVAVKRRVAECEARA